MRIRAMLLHRKIKWVMDTQLKAQTNIDIVSIEPQINIEMNSRFAHKMCGAVRPTQNQIFCRRVNDADWFYFILFFLLQNVSFSKAILEESWHWTS